MLISEKSFRQAKHAGRSQNLPEQNEQTPLENVRRIYNLYHPFTIYISSQHGIAVKCQGGSLDRISMRRILESGAHEKVA